MLCVSMLPRMLVVRIMSVTFSSTSTRGWYLIFFRWVVGAGSQSSHDVSLMNCRLKFWVV